MNRTIRIKKNRWGNYMCFIGTEKVIDFGNDWCATDWLSTTLEVGDFRLSDKSDITQDDVDKFREKIK